MHAPDCTCAECLEGRWQDTVRKAWNEEVAPLPRPPLGPSLVWRDVTCPGCRRFFCTVLTLPDVKLIPHCEGCALEGR